MRYVGLAEARDMVCLGSARWLNRFHNAVMLVYLERGEKPSPASLSFSECMANVGLSSTRGQRISLGRERHVQSKVEAWPFVGDTLAPCVRPRA
jgi:hypothetical protein